MAGKIIKDADYFVLAKVKSYDEQKGVEIEIIKVIAGKPVSGIIQITGFN